MITTVVRNAADLCERMALRFQGWADNLPDSPFDSGLLTVALAVAEKPEGFLAAEIDVPVERIRQYGDFSDPGLSPAEQKALAGFFHRRGIYEVRLLRWFGWRGLVFAPWAVAKEDADRRAAHARVERIVESERLVEFERGLRRGLRRGL